MVGVPETDRFFMTDAVASHHGKHLMLVGRHEGQRTFVQVDRVWRRIFVPSQLVGRCQAFLSSAHGITASIGGTATLVDMIRWNTTLSPPDARLCATNGFTDLTELRFPFADAPRYLWSSSDAFSRGKRLPDELTVCGGAIALVFGADVGIVESWMFANNVPGPCWLDRKSLKPVVDQPAPPPLVLATLHVVDDECVELASTTIENSQADLDNCALDSGVYKTASALQTALRNTEADLWAFHGPAHTDILRLLEHKVGRVIQTLGGRCSWASTSNQFKTALGRPNRTSDRSITRRLTLGRPVLDTLASTVEFVPDAKNDRSIDDTFLRIGASERAAATSHGQKVLAIAVHFHMVHLTMALASATHLPWWRTLLYGRLARTARLLHVAVSYTHLTLPTICSV